MLVLKSPSSFVVRGSEAAAFISEAVGAKRQPASENLATKFSSSPRFEPSVDFGRKFGEPPPMITSGFTAQNMSTMSL